VESGTLRLIIFISTFLSLAILERFFSYRRRTHSRQHRWFGNISLIVISNLAIKLIFPLGVASFALYFESQNWGLFNLINLGPPGEILCSVVLLDFSIYVQHVLFHKIPFIWRFHRVHHADVDLDVTSALRFHPIEILISIAYKIFIVMILGVSAESVLIFEIILSTMAMFNHSNLHIPHKIESFLRFVIVTPQMHLIHHSVDQKESDMNYGFNLSIWDRIFRTYINDFSSEGVVGQVYYRSESEHGLRKILLLPFVNISKGDQK